MSKLLTEINALQQEKEVQRQLLAQTGVSPATPENTKTYAPVTPGRPFAHFFIGLIAGVVLSVSGIVAYMFIPATTPPEVPVRPTPASEISAQVPSHLPPADEPELAIKPIPKPIPPAVQTADRINQPSLPVVAATSSRKTPTAAHKIPGTYPEASSRYLTVDDLKNKTRPELQIMRNEIFARHSLIFNSPVMKTHFTGKAWYTPRLRNIKDRLSRMEIANIALIKKFEGR